MAAALPALLASPEPFGDATVPRWLMGCWRRNWIRFGSGEPEVDVEVIWLQTASGMGDIRIEASQPPTASDSSCGLTIVDESALPHPTARWIDGESGFAQQPTPSFPEDGWLDVRSPDLMLERAPSGAYVEEWERLGGADGPFTHVVSIEPHANLYVAGRHAFYAEHHRPGSHEFTYGTLDLANATIEVALSTLPELTGAARSVTGAWTVVSHRPR